MEKKNQIIALYSISESSEDRIDSKKKKREGITLALINFMEVQKDRRRGTVHYRILKTYKLLTKKPV